MVGPPDLEFASSSSNRRRLRRRLFTNLFLPGSQLASGIRALLWMTVPAPELSVILLDWSSLLQDTGHSASRNIGGGMGLKDDEEEVGSGIGALSQLALPILT